MGEVRAEFLFYCINDLNFTRKEVEDAWDLVNAQDRFKNQSVSVREVITRDVLRGELKLG